MESIISPGRMKYLKNGKREGCIFCKDSSREEDLVLYEGDQCYIIMNKYPYTSGHVMVVPCRHKSELKDLTSNERLEMMKLTEKAVEALKKAFNPEGFNIGINLGKAAGAGVDTHLHIHVVPRWSGDTNFVTVLGEVRIIPEEIEKTRDILMTCF